MDTFREQLAALADAQPGGPSVTILSDLDRAHSQELLRGWRVLPAEARLRLVNEMAELGEEQIEYNFGRALRIALRDEDAQVRARAIEGLWEDDGEDFLAYLLDVAPRDESAEVRASAVQALARFSVLDVQEDIGPQWHDRLRGDLLKLVREGESSEVRRRALEAVAVYSDDREVEGLIDAAYGSSDLAVRMSAVYAMGRNLNRRWFDTILAEIDSPVAGLRYEAVRASGAFGDRRAVPRLVERLGDDDREVQLAAIGSLGQIGGSASMTILKRLAASGDEVVREAAEEALDEATFMSNPLGPGGRLAGDDWG